MCSLWKGFWCGGKPSLSYTSLTFSICCCLKGKYWLSFVLSLFFFKASMLWRLTRCQVYFFVCFFAKKMAAVLPNLSKWVFLLMAHQQSLKAEKLFHFPLFCFRRKGKKLGEMGCSTTERHHTFICLPSLLSASWDNTCLLCKWFTETLLLLQLHLRQFAAKLHSDFLAPMNIRWELEQRAKLFIFSARMLYIRLLSLLIFSILTQRGIN